jgi:hypothetical protein
MGNGGLPVVQSVEPCHLSGDPDLYGLGIRVGFYLQYLAAIIAIVSKADEDFIGWRVAFVPLAAATFLGLCINSTGDSLVIMDWAIMLELVLWFPAFFTLPIFKGISIINFRKKEVNKGYAKQLEPIREAGFDQYADKIASAYRAAGNAEDIIMNDPLDSQRRPEDVRELVNTVTKMALEPVNITEERHAESVDHAGELTQAVSELENSSNNLQAVRAQIEALRLREHHIAALQIIGVTAQEAKEAESTVREIAKAEEEIRHEIKKIDLILERIHGLGLVDAVSTGISLIIYSAYCFLTPWLYFFGIDRGARTGCDVKVLFLLAPVSVYNHGFGIFLKFVAIVSTIAGLAFSLFGIIFLIIGLRKPFEKVAGDNLGTGGEKTDTQTSPGAGLQNHPPHPDLTMTGALVPQDQPQTAHAQPHWLSAHLEAVRHMYHNYVNNSREPSMKEANKEIDFSRRRWGFGLSVVLLETIVVVEMTIQVNHLKMGPLLSSTGQLIALLVGAFMLLLILYRCIVKLYWRYKSEDNKTGRPHRKIDEEARPKEGVTQQ